MELSNILNGIASVKNDINIEGVSIDSREIKEGYMFIAINGFETDGHKYINSAIEHGAKAVLIDSERFNEFKDLDIEVITVPNTREVVAKVACNYYRNPSNEFKLIGVTGTKGKTTTTFMIKKILEEAGHKVGLVGTVANYIGLEKLVVNI